MILYCLQVISNYCLQKHCVRAIQGACSVTKSHNTKQAAPNTHTSELPTCRYQKMFSKLLSTKFHLWATGASTNLNLERYWSFRKSRMSAGCARAASQSLRNERLMPNFAANRGIYIWMIKCVFIIRTEITMLRWRRKHSEIFITSGILV